MVFVFIEVYDGDAAIVEGAPEWRGDRDGGGGEEEDGPCWAEDGGEVEEEGGEVGEGAVFDDCGDGGGDVWAVGGGGFLDVGGFGGSLVEWEDGEGWWEVEEGGEEKDEDYCGC